MAEGRPAMMHGTGTHGLSGMNEFGTITTLLIWTLLILAIIYLYQKTTEKPAKEE
ncbi:hypothetical protein [Candidatus Nanohalobium constans]|uniref:hypothetical protein n=1 Tax=Candidatus Nanohalobium constans TaxID=2565781 RepID=UPI0012984F56|nr:hypothetical protein [Candidatus Nanohalobium constans]